MVKRQGMRPAPVRPYSPRKASATSAIMSKIRSKNNRAELELRRELWKRGYRYRLYAAELPGRPDIVFRQRRLAILVDGDFWHGRALIEGGPRALQSVFRTERRDYWLKKITRNVERDSSNTKKLRKLGWRVVRLWERDILADVSAAADLVERILKKTATRASSRRESRDSESKFG
jgi:DNA mismatch endonuclease (patch repair protein)